MRTPARRQPDAEQIRRRFIALLLAALAIGTMELGGAFLVALGCIGGGEVACYGPANGMPAAPGYHLGSDLRDGAVALTGLVVLLSAAGSLGLRALQKQLILTTAELLIAISIAAAFWGESRLRASPSPAYCHEIQACYSD